MTFLSGQLAQLGVDEALRLGGEAVLSKNSADLDFESMHDTQIDLRGCAMIETKHSTKPLGAFDGARRRFDLVTGFD